MKTRLQINSIIDEVGVLTPALVARVFVRRTPPAALHHREFPAAQARASVASRAPKLAVVIVPSPRVLTARLHPRYFPL